MIRVQERLDHPLADYLARFRRPSSRMLVGVGQTKREIRVGALLMRLLALRGRRRAVEEAA
jgi:hypothetical protein